MSVAGDGAGWARHAAAHRQAGPCRAFPRWALLTSVDILMCRSPPEAQGGTLVSDRSWALAATRFG